MRQAVAVCVGITVVCFSAQLRGMMQLVQGPAAYRPDEVRISLERTECLGVCPAYTLTITGDGVVQYVGSRFVGAEGSRQATISPIQVARLVNEFLRNRFFDLAPVYDGGETVEFLDGKYLRYGMLITDVPSTILSLELGDRSKKVLLRHIYSRDLDQLADVIDEVTQSKRWTARK